MRHFNDFTTKLTVLYDKIVPEKRRSRTQNNNGWLWNPCNGYHKEGQNKLFITFATQQIFGYKTKKVNK